MHKIIDNFILKKIFTSLFHLRFRSRFLHFFRIFCLLHRTNIDELIFFYFLPSPVMPGGKSRIALLDFISWMKARNLITVMRGWLMVAGAWQGALLIVLFERLNSTSSANPFTWTFTSPHDARRFHGSGFSRSKVVRSLKGRKFSSLTKIAEKTG